MPPTAAMRRKREEIVREHMDSENRHEFDATLDTFEHPRYELIATGDVYDGPEEVSGYFEESRRAFPDQRNELSALTIPRRRRDRRGDHPRHPQGPAPQPAAHRAGVRAADPGDLRLRGGRLVCERVYFDQLTVLRQLGIARDPTTLTGRVETLIGHPLTIGRGLVRRVTGR